MKLSAVIITKNEAHNISRSIESVHFADEIIVVDAESTDNTRDIAKKLGAKVFVNPWPGYGLQKNFGAAKAQGDWLLFLDADEEITPELAQEIQEVTEEKLYWFRIITIFLGKPLKHLYGHNLRLLKKDSAKWTDTSVHEQVANQDGPINLEHKDSVILPSPLLHHSHPTIKSYFKKMHKYTSLDAEEMHKTGKHRSGRPIFNNFFLPFHLSIRQFIKLYFYRRGFLDGFAGFLWCVLSGYYEFEMAKKYLNS